MDIRFQNASGGEWSAACVLAFAFAGEEGVIHASALREQAPWLDISPGLRDFSGKKNESCLVWGHPELPLSRVLCTGLGPKDRFDLDVFRDAVAVAVQTCRDRAFDTLGLPVEVLEGIANAADLPVRVLVREAALAALLGLYRFDDYKSRAKGNAGGSGQGNAILSGQQARAVQDDEPPADPRWLAFLFTDKETPDALHRAAREGEAEAAGVILARNLANGPGNHVTPEVLAQAAQTLARSNGFTCRVLDGDQIRDLGMGALWAVGRGSSAGPRFIILEHCPEGKEDQRPYVFVGKGITFDTGGISLKPSAKMHEMKGDMGGAAAVLGLFAALGALPGAEELPRVVGLIPTAENMPDGNATRPGDVVTTLSGKTVEILNTDAEGRLVLCDALTYAQREWSPAALMDIATLTGACVVALGDYGTGLFTADEELRDAVMNVARETGDLVWPLPLWDKYDAHLKSDIADMTNMGPREGAAVNAALFLRRFIEEGTRWAHLDIAGPGYVVKAAPLLPVPGGTGVGVRLLLGVLRGFGGEAA